MRRALHNRFHVTNAYAESLNGLIKVISRSGRGYTFDILRAQVVFNDDFHRFREKPPDDLMIAEDCVTYGNICSFRRRPSAPGRKLLGADISTLERKYKEGCFK